METPKTGFLTTRLNLPWSNAMPKRDTEGKSNSVYPGQTALLGVLPEQSDLGMQSLPLPFQ